jgi:hypothetical protein
MINDGIVHLNSQDFAPKTIIVLGVARGGTSMVAKTLHLAGVSMNSNVVTYEDLDLGNAIEQDDKETVLKLIDTRNKSLVWGFKRPNSISNLHKYINFFEKPVFVTVFRDILATAKRNQLSMNWTLETALTEAIEKNSALVKFIESQNTPNLLVSYEKVIQNPSRFVTSLLDFCKLKADNQLLVSNIKANNSEYLGIQGE